MERTKPSVPKLNRLNKARRPERLHANASVDFTDDFEN
jgi:hypothetical protein